MRFDGCRGIQAIRKLLGSEKKSCLNMTGKDELIKTYPTDITYIVKSKYLYLRGSCKTKVF